MEKRIKFIYNEAAVVVNNSGVSYLVIGDLHIGAERRFIHKGLHIYSSVEFMQKKIEKLMKKLKIDKIIILGDIKESILYPDEIDTRSIKSFFNFLSKYDFALVSGNHDAHLKEILNVEMKDEILIGDFAFLHGHKFPSEEAMSKKYIFAAHNHIAISLRDKNLGFYNQKAWLVSPVSKINAKKIYDKFNDKIKLVVLPAFNELIIGTPVNEKKEEYFGPLFKNKVFDYNKGSVYSLRGELLGTPRSLTQSS